MRAGELRQKDMIPTDTPASLRETQRGLVQHQAVQAPGAGLDRLQEGLAVPVLLELVVGAGKRGWCTNVPRGAAVVKYESLLLCVVLW